MVRPTLTGLLALLAVAAPARQADRDPHALPPAAQSILEQAETLELYSLHPERPKEEPKDSFHGWTVLGKTTVADAATRKRVAEALVKGVTEYTGPAAKCFDPRHGIRATAGGKTADFVICFACYQVRVSAGGKDALVLVSRSPAAALDDVLRKAGVPPAPGAEGK